jgi:hypothetical protein
MNNFTNKKIYPKFLLIISLSLAICPLFGQIQDNGNGKKANLISLTALGSVGYSFLRYNSSDMGSTYPTSEFRLGITAEKKMANRFLFLLGLRAGYKPRAKPAFDPAQFPSQPNSYFKKELEETMTFKSHYFVELPVSLGYEFNKFQFTTGISGRYYFKSGDSTRPDFISGSYELGIPVTISYKLINRLRIGAQYYFGVTPLYRSGIVILNGETQPEVKASNNFLSLNVDYKF